MTHCERCGTVPGDQPHPCAVGIAELEPPRFCQHCGRRMVVQVTPRGWSANCVEHGVRTG